MANYTETATLPLAVAPTEAARLLSIGRSTLYRLINEGKLPTRKIGARTLIRRADIEHLLEEPTASGS